MRLENQVSKEADKVANSLENIGNKATKIGSQMTAFATIPIAGAMVSATKAAMDWESAFTGVRKTVDASETEFAVLEDQLRSLATDSVLSSLENAHLTIAQIAESAGQLGVKKDDIAEFTQVIGELTMSTNLAADEAATMIAQFANVSKMPLSDVRRFSDVLVTLGNNAATTEKDIMMMAQRLSSIANVGFNPDEILAFSSALSSLGITAELGGTNFMKAVNEINTAVAQGGAELQKLADVADMSSKQFQAAWQEDAAGAMQSFIEGLGRLPASEQVRALEELGLTGSEMQRVFLSLASDTSLLAEQMNLANDAFAGNNALADEAAKRAQTAQANFNSLGNSLYELRIAFGEVLLPIFIKVVDGLKGLIDWFAKLPEPVRQAIVIVGGLVAVLGPVLMVIGSVISAIGTIGGAISGLAGLFGGLSAIVAGASAAFATLGGILITFAAPIAIAIAAIAAIGAAIYLLWTNRNQIGEWAQNVWDGMKKAGQAAKETGQNIVKDLWAKFEELFPKTAEAMKRLGSAFREIGVAIIKGLIEGVRSQIDNFLKMVVDLANNVANSVKNALKIKSPSKVMQGLGENVVAGFNKGIESMGGVGVNVNGTQLSAGGSTPSMAAAGAGGGRGITIGTLILQPTSANIYDEINRKLAKDAARQGFKKK